jgi:putative spermidine/putrescine transport system substrate-binding protein
MGEMDFDTVSGFSRREFIKRAGALGLGAALGGSGLLSACAPAAGGGDQPVQLTHFIWVGGGQGIVPREVKAEYERDHPNVAIELYEGTNATTYPKMVAQKEVDPNKPLINFGFFNIDATTKGTLDDMWISLDPEKIPHMNDVYEPYWRPENKGIVWGISGVGLMYNPELVEEPPTSWNDIFDPRFKGQVAVWDYAWGFNGLAAVAHANGGDEENIDVSFDLYSQAAKDGQFRFFFDSNQAIKDAMVRGEVAVAPFFNSFPINWGPKGEGGPFAYAIPEEGMVAFPLLFQIVKGSSDEQIAVAEEIVDIYLSPEVLGRYCSLTANVPTSEFVKLDKDYALEPAFDKDNVANAMQLDWAAIATHNTEWKERWDREVKAYM